MNNRFKFRIWDKEAKCIQYPISIYNYMGYGEVAHPIRSTYEGKDCIETCPPNPEVIDGFRRYQIEDYVLMQCTGLKDKNEKDIYEGDIIKWTSPSEGEANIQICEVYFIDGAFHYLCHRGVGKNKSYNKDWEYYEVIGNIYENPELLNPTCECGGIIETHQGNNGFPDSWYCMACGKEFESNPFNHKT